MSRISRIRQKCPVVNLSMHDAHEMASCDLGRLRSATASTFLRPAALMNPEWLKFARRREKGRRALDAWGLAPKARPYRALAANAELQRFLPWHFGTANANI